MYVDNLDKATAGSASAWDSPYSGSGTDATNSMDIVVKYMNNSSTSGTASDADMKKYGICNIANVGWFVYYNFKANGGNLDSRIASKLAGRASSTGLVGGAAATNLTTSGTYTDTNDVVGMWVVKP